jgi:ABC-2 type transport system ATP-binding protein
VSPLVEVEALSKRYRNSAKPAVDHVSFTVHDGEIFGLIGADGAGKTTIFEILAGVLEPTSGQVRILGQPPRLRRDVVGYLTQRFSLYQDLSVAENLRFSAGLRSVPAPDASLRAERYLHAFGLAPFRHRLAGRLSGGMKQKLALSCALIAAPRLLILDEPTTGVDPVSRRDFWDTLAELAAGGMTILLATPYLDEAERCHRVALIEQGVIHSIDSPSGFRAALRLTRLSIRTPQLARAEASLRQAGFDDVQRVGDRLDVLVTAPASARQTITSHLPGAAIHPVTPTLENALVATLRRMRHPAEPPPFPHPSPSPPASAEVLLHAASLQKRFGDFCAVRDFHLELRRGETYGLLGANGAGKTTAIKMMCGLLQPTSGSVSLLGQRRGLRSAALRRRIGYMSQKFTLYDDLTIGENLDFYAALYGIQPSLRRARKQWVLATSDLHHEENLLTRNLPGGWKQRVAFGAAIMHEPELIFLDEPTSGVDPLARRAMWRMINELADRGAALLVVTHYLEEAEQCSRIGFMADGELILEGSPGELRRRASGQLLEIEPLDTRAALTALRRAGLRVSQFGSRLHVQTDLLEHPLQVLRQAAVQWTSAHPVEFTLEDVFLQWIEQRKVAS